MPDTDDPKDPRPIAPDPDPGNARAETPPAASPEPVPDTLPAPESAPVTAPEPAAPQTPDSQPAAPAVDAGAASPAYRCPKCGAGFGAEARFCALDGTALTAAADVVPCGRCGRVAQPGEKFCPVDGSPFGAPASGFTGKVDRAGSVFDRAGRKIETLVTSGYVVNIGGYFGRAWDYFKDYPLGYLGFGVVALLVLMTGVGILIAYPLFAGASWVAWKQRRGEPVKFSDFFHGFNRFVPLFVGGLLAWIFMVLGLFTCGILTVYLAVAYQFFVDLVLFKGLDFGPALETSRKLIHKQWFEFFVFFLLVSAILAISISLGVVLAIFTIPFSLLATHAAYEEIVGYD